MPKGYLVHLVVDSICQAYASLSLPVPGEIKVQPPRAAVGGVSVAETCSGGLHRAGLSSALGAWRHGKC